MLRLLKITGESLTPEFQEGDFVLVSKVPLFFYPASPGDIIAFRQPGYGLLIKRVQSVGRDGTIKVIGSHPESIDSRVFGPTRPKDIIGKVVWHIRKG
jgi:signal peptidase I